MDKGRIFFTSSTVTALPMPVAIADLANKLNEAGLDAVLNKLCIKAGSILNDDGVWW